VPNSGASLGAQLRARLAEIDQVARARVYAVSDPESYGPEYAHGLKATVAVAVEHVISVIEGSERDPQIPAALLNQARMAARSAVGLDIVLQRYSKGFTLFTEFLLEVAEQCGHPGGAELGEPMRALAGLYELILRGITEEYRLESARLSRSPERKRAERVMRLLEGEMVDTHDLEYDFEGHHLGLVAHGQAARAAVCELAKATDCRLLIVHPDEERAWAWLGSREGIERETLDRVLASSWPAHVRLALGGPGRGMTGWRLTHRQAAAALSLAHGEASGVVRYADNPLLVAAIGDEVLAASLYEIYLAPLSRSRNEGIVLRKTMRAYIAANRNVKSASHALGVSRQTVNNHLKAAEKLLGRTIPECGPGLEVALRLEEAAAQAGS
jgi:hypothetical protein